MARDIRRGPQRVPTPDDDPFGGRGLPDVPPPPPTETESVPNTPEPGPAPLPEGWDPGGRQNPDGSVEAPEPPPPATPPPAPVPPPPPPPPAAPPVPAPVAASAPAPTSVAPTSATPSAATPAPATPAPASAPSALEQKLLEQLTATANQRDTFNAAVRDRVMAMLQPTEAPSIEDPDLAPQQAAFTSAARKANERRRAQMAERMAAQGNLDSGAFDSVVERGLADTQSLEAGNAANLVGQRMQQRMAELQTVMQLGAGIMSSDEQRQLQQEMALLDAEMRRTQFDGDLNLRKTLGGGQMNLGLLDLMMRNSQFNDQLGFKIGAFGQQSARDSILNLL